MTTKSSMTTTTTNNVRVIHRRVDFKPPFDYAAGILTTENTYYKSPWFVKSKEIYDGGDDDSIRHRGQGTQITCKLPNPQ